MSSPAKRPLFTCSLETMGIAARAARAKSAELRMRVSVTSMPTSKPSGPKGVAGVTPLYETRSPGLRLTDETLPARAHWREVTRRPVQARRRRRGRWRRCGSSGPQEFRGSCSSSVGRPSSPGPAHRADHGGNAASDRRELRQVHSGVVPHVLEHVPCPRCRCCRWRPVRRDSRRGPTASREGAHAASIPGNTLASPMRACLEGSG